MWFTTKKLLLPYVLNMFSPQTMSENISPSKSKYITDMQISKCLTLDWFALSQRAMASELGCDQSTVQQTLNYYNYKTFVERRRAIGCPQKTWIADDRQMIRDGHEARWGEWNRYLTRSARGSCNKVCVARRVYLVVTYQSLGFHRQIAFCTLHLHNIDQSRPRGAKGWCGVR